MKIYLSHMAEEFRLAAAWAELLRRISRGALQAWYAGGPGGGQAEQQLRDATFLLAILTPRSAERPWLLWECGIAQGQGKAGIVPVVYGCSPGGPLGALPATAGDDQDEVAALCRKLLAAAGLEEPGAQDWETALEEYFEAIRLPLHALKAVRRLIPAPAWQIDDALWTGAPARLVSVSTDAPAVAYEVHSRLSGAYLEQRQFEPALAEVEKSLALAPGDPGLLLRKGQALLELGRTTECKKVIGQLHRLDGNHRLDPEIAGLEARLHQRMWKLTGDRGHLASAAKAYRRAYEKHPENYLMGAGLARLSHLVGDHRTARVVGWRMVALCLELQQQEPVSWRVDFALGELYVVLDDLGRAREEFARGLQRAPRPGVWALAGAVARLRELLGPEESRGFEELLS